ncbi:MAG: recombination protein RecR [Desulfuromonas sp.]|nr:MAG: recombination protein RecR [Desulfuromonas sp.]
MIDSLPSLSRLIAEMAKLPGIGRKSAARLAFHVLRQSEAEATALAQAIIELKDRVRFCTCCFSVTEEDPCTICQDVGRDSSKVCVVEQPQDLIAIERSRSFTGRYHVLHGALSPLERVGPEDLKIAPLLSRLEQGGVDEVLLATNFSVEGEATALYLAGVIRPLGIEVTRLAYGIPLGSDLEYVDEATVNRAVEGRRTL